MEQTTKTAHEMPTASKRIWFEDRGQDLLHVDIDYTGMIVDCPKNHRPIWIGRFIDLETINKGKCPDYIDSRLGRDKMRYRVSEVERLNEEQ